MSGDFNNVRILVVDDHESMRRIISTLLRALGFPTIVEAHDGAEALKKVTSFRPDIVITDFNMPVLNGVALVEHLRGSDDPAVKTVPVIMVSGHASEPNIRAALAAGINEFLAKPITGRSLADRIKRLMAA